MMQDPFAILSYIDPGTGSYIFQLLIAGLTAVVFFFASMKRRILGWFGKRGEGQEVNTSNVGTTDSSAQPDAEAGARPGGR